MGCSGFIFSWAPVVSPSPRAQSPENTFSVLQRTLSSFFKNTWRKKETLLSALPSLLFIFQASSLFSVPLLLQDLWEKKNQFTSSGQPVKFAHRSPNHSQMNPAAFLLGYNSIKPPNGLYHDFTQVLQQQPVMITFKSACRAIILSFPGSSVRVNWAGRGRRRSRKTKPWVLATSGYTS